MSGEHGEPWKFDEITMTAKFSDGAPVGRDEIIRRGKRTCDCVNAMNGIKNPQACMEAILKLVAISHLVKGYVPDSIRAELNSVIEEINKAKGGE